MSRKSQIITQSCFQAVILAAVLLHGNAATENDTLVITAHQEFNSFYIDGTIHSLPFGEIWNISDRVHMEPNTRLIAFEAISAVDSCAGVLASTISNSLLTDARFKCRDVSDVDWEQLGYDDSNWPNAVEYGNNTNGHSACSHKQIFTDIDANAKWIWTIDTMNDFVVFCRGYTSLCELSSPCLNNGTCLKNDQAMCSCLPQFTGRFCEAELSTGTPEDTTDEMTTLTKSTLPVSITDTPETTKVTTTGESVPAVTSSTSPATEKTTPSEAVSGSSADASRTTSITTQIGMITSDNIIISSNMTETTTNSGDLTTGTFGECGEQFYCNGPLEVPGSSIEHCYCPSGYLNTSDNCCLNQWWIIGLSLISAAVLVVIIIALIACFGCPCKSKKRGDLLEAADVHRNGPPLKAVKVLPETGVGVTKGPAKVAVHSETKLTATNEKATHPATVKAAAVPIASSAKSAPTQPQHPHSEHNGTTDYGTSQDLLYNPLMVELLASEVGRTFRPSLESIPSNIEYVIKRSSVSGEKF